MIAVPERKWKRRWEKPPGRTHGGAGVGPDGAPK